MQNERHADMVEGKFDLNCTVVNCVTNVTVFHVSYVHDGLGNLVPPDLRGPYIRHWGRHGGDWKTFIDGSMIEMFEEHGQILVRPYALIIRDNEFSQDCADLPKFGFGIGKVSWFCLAHTRLYRDRTDLQPDIILEAAEEERHREVAADHAVRRFKL